jgi:hypothetical protein
MTFNGEVGEVFNFHAENPRGDESLRQIYGSTGQLRGQESDRASIPGRSSCRAKRMVVAHLIRLAAGIVGMVIVIMLMRVGDLVMRVFGGTPLRGAIGVET